MFLKNLKYAIDQRNYYEDCLACLVVDEEEIEIQNCPCYKEYGIEYLLSKDMGNIFYDSIQKIVRRIKNSETLKGYTNNKKMKQQQISEVEKLSLTNELENTLAVKKDINDKDFNNTITYLKLLKMEIEKKSTDDIIKYEKRFIINTSESLSNVIVCMKKDNTINKQIEQINSIADDLDQKIKKQLDSDKRSSSVIEQWKVIYENLKQKNELTIDDKKIKDEYLSNIGGSDIYLLYTPDHNQLYKLKIFIDKFFDSKKKEIFIGDYNSIKSIVDSIELKKKKCFEENELTQKNYLKLLMYLKVIANEQDLVKKIFTTPLSPTPLSPPPLSDKDTIHPTSATPE